MSKGKRRERQAAELYERAGYETFRPQESKFGETDMFGLFDILALGNGEVRMAQVKSNRAAGLEAWTDEVTERFAENGTHPAGIYADYLVCHDREGWRFIGACDGTGQWEVFVDEREGHDPLESPWSIGSGTSYDMGEGVVEYLGGTVDG